MSTQFVDGKFRGETDAGLPLVGGLLDTFVAGTTTPKTTFQSASAFIPNTNPIVLNARGEADVWWETGAIRMRLRTPAGVTIWDVDNIPVAGQEASQLRADLASTISASLGPNLVGFDPTLNYAAATIGAAAQDEPVNVMWFLTTAERNQVKNNFTINDLTTKISAAKTWGGNRPLYLPAGTWSFTSLDFKGNLGGIIGDGIGVTILKVRSAVTRALDFNDTTDTNPRSYILKGFTLDGSNVTTTGIDIRYRHAGVKDSIYVVNCTTGIKELDTYLTRNRNVRVAANGIGWWLVGSNHASTHEGCTYDSNTTGQLLVQSLGTPADGNFGLTWTGCDFEFGGASAYGIDIDCDDATFLGGYFGENISQNGLVVRRGNVKFFGGSLYFGYTTNSYGVTPLGGKVLFQGTVVNGQTNPGIERLVGGLPSLAGKVKFQDITFNGLVSGTPAWVGDVLDYGPQGQVYAERLGKNWTVQTNNVTASSTISGNQQTFTVLTAPGPSPLLGANCPLTNSSKWLDGAPLYLVLIYESSKPITVRTSNGAFGAAVLTIASLPATSGTRSTALCFQTNATATPATLLEIIQSSSGAGDTLVIYEAFLADARMLNRGVGAVGNLYKC